MSRGVIGLVGAGAVGPAIALRLSRAGWTIGTVASRRRETAEVAAKALDAAAASTENADAAAGADLLLLAVPDRAIESVAAEIAAAGALREGALVLHFSGAKSSVALRPLSDARAVAGSIHPLQSFADPLSAVERLPSSFLFYEGEDPERIRAVAEDLGGRPVPIDPEGKVLYHAGAAAACNLMVAMVDLGVRLFGEAGIGPADALKALLPLIDSTTRNLRKVGLPDALTGPVARGDLETVAGHIEAIRRKRPDLLVAYAEASRHAVRISREKGSLTREGAEELRRLLSDLPSRE